MKYIKNLSEHRALLITFYTTSFIVSELSSREKLAVSEIAEIIKETVHSA